MGKSEIFRRVKFAAVAILTVWFLLSAIDAEAHKSIVAEYNAANMFAIINTIGGH